MPLEPPQLDDRSFDDLLAEAKLRIQRYCPDWSDFNDSDPGMALVQLFAWLTELTIYRLNQVPERNYIQFLKMLNLERHAARPAKTQVVLDMASAVDPKVKPVRERSKFLVTAESGDVLTFETLEGIDLIPYPLDAVQVFNGLSFDDYSETNKNTSNAEVLPPLGWTPQQGNSLYLGFAPAPTKPIQDPKFPEKMVLRFFFPTGPGSEIRGGGEISTGQLLPKLIWEYPSKLDRADALIKSKEGIPIPFEADRWRELQVIEDGTASLTREGTVQLRGPIADCLATSSPKPVDEAQRFWIRCRLVDGTYPKELTPKIAFVRCNVIEVENRTTIQNEVVAIGDGTTSTFQLANHPVDEKSLQLFLMGDDDQTSEQCILKEDLHNSKVDDLHFTLNPNSGEIRFGDGKHGRIPGAGQRLVAVSYKAGGGKNGNIQADAIKDPPLGISGVDKVTNPRPATGGQDEEPLNSLLDRAPRVLRGDARAVTKDDYRKFTEEIPGVGRAIILPQYLPEQPCLKVPGAITVVVIPRAPRPLSAGELGPPRYVPATELLQTVADRLDECRPAGTELVVKGPRFRELQIEVKIKPMPGVADELAREEVQKALEHYFQPVEDLPSPEPTIDPQTHQRKKSPPPRWELETPIYPSRLYEVLLTARDRASDMLLVQEVAGLLLKVNQVEQPLGSAIQLEKDELPHVEVTVQIAAPTSRRIA